MDREAKLRELENLRGRVDALEAELAQNASAGDWPPRSYYTTYHVLAGCVLGMFGAAASLLFNIIGSLIVSQHPLKLIQIYLTFPMGEVARDTSNGLALAIGCCLYLATGMVLGIPIHLVLTRWFDRSSLSTRFLVVSLLSLALYLFNFYALLSWLQPLLFGGRWIVDEIPWWVGASTHLVFGWTLLLLEPFGVFVPYQQQRGVA